MPLLPTDCRVHKQDLETPEVTYKRLGSKLVVGMPFKDIATSDTLLMHTVPPQNDTAGRRALKRLQASILKPSLPMFMCSSETCCSRPAA